MAYIEITSITDFHSALERYQELNGFADGTPEAAEREMLLTAIEIFNEENLAYDPPGDHP